MKQLIMAGAPPGHRGRTWLVLLLVLVITLILCGTAYLIIRNVTASASDLFRPSVSVTNVLHAAINNVQRESKLVVTSADLTPEVERKEVYYWWFIYMGTTAARVRAPGSRVQYVIPLEQFGTANIDLDRRQRVVRVYVPEPQLDESLVSVNLEAIEEEKSSAWSRFNKNEVAAEARKGLRAATIAAGSKDFIKAQIRESAKVSMAQLLMPLQESLAPGVRLEVVVR